MGTYLYTGLIHEFRASKSYRSDNHSLELFKAQVAGIVVNNPDCYSCEEADGMIVWRLRREAKASHLVELLNRYYGDFYGLQSSYYIKFCRPVIDFFTTRPSDDELKLGLQGSDGFSELEGWSRRVNVCDKEVTVYFSVWSLSCEGKVMFEELEQHLKFFEKAIRRTYAENPLSGSLMVDVG